MPPLLRRNLKTKFIIQAVLEKEAVFQQPAKLTLAFSCNLSNMRFSYMNEVIQTSYGDSIDLWDCQFVNIHICLGGYNCNAGLHNVLIDESASDSPLYCESSTVTAENVTWDGYTGSSGLCIPSGGINLLLTNCLVTYPDGSGGTYVSTNDTNWTDVSVPVYQTAGAGAYYLAHPNSPYTNAGTTNITPALLVDLAQRRPPIPRCG